MTLKLQIIVIVLLALFGISLISRVQKKKLDLRHTLVWMFLTMFLLILTIFPGLLDAISQLLGIYSPVNMIFFCGFLFSLLIIYTLTISVSKLSEEVKKLAQKIALLEERIRSMEEKEGK